MHTTLRSLWPCVLMKHFRRKKPTWPSDFGDDFRISKVWVSSITYSIHCAGGAHAQMEITSGSPELRFA